MIGIFDSGLGGLTVARAIMEELPREKIVYFGDTARGPYGNKAPEVVAKYARENAEFLLRKKVKAIVVGCNTASAVAGLNLRRAFPSTPIFEVITPAVREALRVTKNGRVGIIGTRTTVQSGAYRRWFRNCTARACPLFVPLVEAGKIDDFATADVARHYLRPFCRAQVDTLILGCTHYPFLKPIISRIMGPRVILVDSAQTVAREVACHPVILSACLRRQAAKNPVLKRTGSLASARDDAPPAHQFYVSKKTPRFQELAEKWLGTEIKLKLARV